MEDELRSHEAIAQAISRHTVKFAKALGLSTSLINKWQEPNTDWSDSGAYNPLDRIETIIETSLKLGTPPEDALAPIHFLAQRFGLIIVQSPKPGGDLKDISNALIKTIKEFADMTQAASKALEDNKLTHSEVALIRKESWELIEQAVAFMMKIDERVKK